MAGWFVDPGLAVLVRQLRAAYPGITIGTIGDASHSSRTSDHNPDPDGSVDAIDPMVGTSLGFTASAADKVVHALVDSRDQRIAYLIWHRQIWKASTGWRDYTREDPHTGHFHLSVNDLHHTDHTAWDIGRKRTVEYVTFETKLPLLSQGDSDPVTPDGTLYITRMQWMLNVADDGDYGPATAKALKDRLDFAGYNGKTVGEREWRKLYALWSA